ASQRRRAQSEAPLPPCSSRHARRLGVAALPRAPRSARTRGRLLRRRLVSRARARLARIRAASRTRPRRAPAMTDELARALVERALLEGDFVLRSGRRSSWYLDKYRFETEPELLRTPGARIADVGAED